MTTPHLYDDIAVDEGLRLTPYKDTKGIWTIAVGHNMEVDPAMKNKVGFYTKNPMTKAQAMALLKVDVAKAMDDLDRLLPWWRKLDDVRQDVVVNMAFNMGANKLRTDWGNTMNDIRDGHYVSAARRIRTSKYATQVGARALRNASQLETGVRSHT